MALQARIQLRHDDLSAWQESTKVLLYGEMAVAKLSNNTFEMRVGDGQKTWNELSSHPIVWQPSQISGLEQYITNLSNSFYEVSSLAELTDSYTNGDIAVVKKNLGTDTAGNGISSYTAYFYDSKLATWRAMDGNYSADNIYFDYDIIKAGAWPSLGNISHTVNKVEYLNSTGKSLKEVMDMIFKGNEVFPQTAANNKPTCTVSQTSQIVEVGTTVTPKFTITFNKRTYPYGSNTNTNLNSTTGVTPNTYTLEYTDSQTRTLTGSFTTSTINGSSSFNAQGGTNSNGAKLSVDYSAATNGTYIPRTNLERVLSSSEELSLYRLGGGTCSVQSSSDSIIGYYPNFYGFRTGENLINVGSITSQNLRGLTNQTSSPLSNGKINPLGTATTSSPWRQFFYALPHGLRTKMSAQDSHGLPFTVHKIENITVNHVNSVTSDYDVFYIEVDANQSPTTLTLTWQ